MSTEYTVMTYDKDLNFTIRDTVLTPKGVETEALKGVHRMKDGDRITISCNRYPEKKPEPQARHNILLSYYCPCAEHEHCIAGLTIDPIIELASKGAREEMIERELLKAVQRMVEEIVAHAEKKHD